MYVLRRAILIVLGLLLSWVPPGTAQSSPQPTLHILHDVPDDGYTYVGNPVRFGYVLLDENGATTVHHDGKIAVTLNNVTLYETSMDAGHDYDVLNTFQIAFPAPGPYTVHAEVPGGGSVVYTEDFHGIVHPNPATTKAELLIEDVPDGATHHFTFTLLNQTGGNIHHSDVDVEIRRAMDNWLIFRTHLHSHQDPMTMSYTFPLPGSYLVRAVGYMAFPEADAPHFEAVAATTNIDVATPPAQGIALSFDPPAGNRPFALLSTIDPQASSTPFSRFVISGLVHNTSSNAFVPHVNFEAYVVHVATGIVVFASESLHEYDSNFDLVMHYPLPGLYRFVYQAQQGEWSAASSLDFVVAEVLPTDGLPLISSAGVVVIQATGLDTLKSGGPSAITLRAQTPAGTPAMHSEIDYQILRTAWGPPVLLNKVHTHDSGDFEVQITFPDPGSYILVLDPVNIHGEPTLNYYFGDIGGALAVPLTVQPGTLFPAAPPIQDEAPPLEPEKVLPGFEVALLVAALASVVVLRRRRPLA